MNDHTRDIEDVETNGYAKIDRYNPAGVERMSKHVRGLLDELGEDATREGLEKTPERVAKALQYLTHGYALDPAAILRSAMFREEYQQMVIVRDIEVYSLCEHHMLPFFGKAHVAYIPNGQIVGLSKIPRIVDAFARRLQVQERLTVDVRNCIEDTLKPLGVAVVIEAQHLCMQMRGIQKQHSIATTSAFTGEFNSEKTRGDFLRLIMSGERTPDDGGNGRMSAHRTSEFIVERVLPDVRKGRMVILVDSAERENEGDLFVAAEKATPEAIVFMATHARGLVSLALTEERMRELGLALITDDQVNTTRFQTAFATPIDAREGVSSGMSAHDRARTIATAIADGTRPTDLIRPGRLQTLRAVAGGVLARRGHTEAAVDLARLAGLKPAGVICEIMNDDGTMARMPELERFAQQHGIAILRIADLVAYRETERAVRRRAETVLPTRKAGDFKLIVYADSLETSAYVALVKGDIGAGPTLVRLHSQCLTGDVFGSERCDCGEQLEAALATIEQAGRGVLVYMFDEGRGIGLLNKIRAYALQDEGHDTIEANHALGFAADMRDYSAGAHILFDLGVREVRLMTNNPDKVEALESYGLTVVERVPVETAPRPANRGYLQTKRTRFGHLLSLVGDAQESKKQD